MTRLVDRRVRWRRDASGRLIFRWQGRWHQVQCILEIWRDTGLWWEGEAEKTFLRVETAAPGLFELYRCLGEDGILYLYRVYD